MDALGPAGWGSCPGSDGPGTGLLALEPEVVFAGGFAALREARRWLDDARCEAPLGAVLVGCIDYELGLEICGGRVSSKPGSASAPVRLAGFRAVYRYDWRTGDAEVRGSSRRAVDRLADAIAVAKPGARSACVPLRPPVSRTTDLEFAAAIERVKAYIRAGDVYQVNLSRRLETAAPKPADQRRLLGLLADRAGAPFTAYLETPEQTVVSASPECFLRVSGDRVQTCPIKGTRPRGRTPALDSILLKELESSAKDRAEHVMIVDLERNDLGRVCETGSVRVTRLCEPRSFSDVHHLVSCVSGRLRNPRDWPSLLEATFPGGSITGAPKLRAMQIIGELEPVPRGVYTGALGVFDSVGDVDLSIAIRTAVSSGSEMHLHLGGGIVADSDVAEELRETRDKGRAFSRSWEFEERTNSAE